MKNINWPARLFVTGIDTDAGKSYATGWIAQEIASLGESVITQKFIQTGNQDMSEDIEVHRRLMGTGYLPEDLDHTTAPIIFTYPASPDLAAKIDGREIDFSLIEESTEKLASKYSHVLIEGAGGIMVPLKDDYLTIDYVREHKLPTVVVTNSRLGSINHTLLTLLALQQAGVEVFAVIYNPHFDKDKMISADTREYLQKWLTAKMPETLLLEMGK
jgi:dethiobiotin synthetase